MAESVQTARPRINREGEVTYKGAVVGKVEPLGKGYAAYLPTGKYIGWTRTNSAARDALAVRYDAVALDGLAEGGPQDA